MILLRVWVSGRMWRELLYVLTAAVLRVPAFALALLGIVSSALSVLVLGLGLLAAVLFVARLTPRWFRGPARRLLGWDWPASPPLTAPTRWARFLAVFGDSTAWRALAYCFVSFPVLFAGAYGTVIGIGSGLTAVTFPAWWFHRPEWFGVDSHTWPQTWREAGLGLLLLLVVPWFLRVVVLLDGLLVRGLLHPGPAARRIADLEAARAALQEDAAALLRRVERDLHDGTQARLVSLGMTLSRIERQSSEPPVRAVAADARQTVTEALAELRDIVRGMHPPALDDGLDVALTTLAGRSAVPATVAVGLSARPPDPTASALYFAAAELLTNIARHAEATRAEIRLDEQGDRLTLLVRDDGRGGASPEAGGTGLSGLTRRAEALDGGLHVSSPTGGPTTITMTVRRT